MKGLWLTSEVVTNIRVYELQFIDSGTGTRTRGAEFSEAAQVKFCKCNI